MDSISKLPDSIRNYIVSFLPMEEAIRTSVLSTQWRNVCYSLTEFEFCEKLLEEKIKKGYNFEDIVDQTICRHDGSSIETFKLTFKAEDFHDEARVNSWITFAIIHKVKHLTISIPKFNSLPDCLFTCESLTNLHLWNVTLNTPAELRFPMLKMLLLMLVEFNGNNQTNKLVVNCHLLEFLSIYCCSWKNTDDLIIHARNLETLSLARSSPHNVSVHCPLLSTIHHYGHPPDISSESLSSLLDVSFSCPFDIEPKTTMAQNVVDQRVNKIVMGLSNVVSLSLDQFWLEILSRNGGIISNQALPFLSLKSLSVRMFAEESQVFMPVLLKICPNLNTLYICFTDQDEHTNMLNMGGYFHQQQLLSDEDSFKSLVKVTIKDFEGTDWEFNLVMYLLEKTKILEEIEITCSERLDEDEPYIRRITEEFTQLTTISPCVTATIYSNKEATNKRHEDWIAQLAQLRLC